MPRWALILNFAVMFMFGALIVLNHVEKVRAVHVIGSAAGGAICGASLAGIVATLVVRRKRALEDKKLPDTQLPPL